VGTTHDPTLGLLELVLELFHHEVHSHQRIGGRSMSTEDPTMAGQDHFATLTIGDPRVVFLGEVHFGSFETRAVPEQSAHLLLDQRPYLVGHYSSAVRDDNVHLFASQVVLAFIVAGVVGRYSYSVMGWILSVLWMRSYRKNRPEMHRDLRAADLVFDPTLACGENGGRVPAAPTGERS
jgi:hypothetical protein